MATLRPCVQKLRSDGFYPVYIRVTHERKIGYIKTDKMVSKKDVSKSKEIRDNFVLNYCTSLIERYNQVLNRFDISNWSLKEVIECIQNEEADVCFSEYAKLHISRMKNRGQERNAKNYQMSVNSLELYLGTTRVMFSSLTSTVVNNWIESLSKTKRAKEMYPVCIRQIFKAAVKEYNDYDMGKIRIKTNPWLKVDIPQADRTEKKAISPEACREFFGSPLPDSKMAEPLSEFGRDIAMLVLCLAGINTVDLYNLKKEDYKNGVIGYCRAKTRNSRRDNAYIEMRVEPILFPLFEKYKADKNDPYLFRFRKRYSTSDSFNANVNNGIKQVCKSMGMKEDSYYSAYTFRHTWGTVAQNDCEATIADVGFAMNHSHGHTVTRGYIKIDFTPAWELNKKVIDFIFYSQKKSKQGIAKGVEEPKDKLFRLSPKKMIYGAAYYKGETLAQINDTGFSKVDDVIKELVKQLPDTIPNRASVQFLIRNMDTGKETAYVHTKGKGF